MESIMHNIRTLYDDMGRSEKRIADYILSNSQSIIEMSISELASKCGSGDATVVRFSRRLGFTGYQALKLGIAAEISSVSAIDRTINKTDSCYEIFQKRINDILISLKNTESVLNHTQLELAAKSIMAAKKIIIFGLGNSSAIAMDATHKFLRLGLNAQACCDNHMQAIIASHLNRDSVAIGVSHSGNSKDIIDALRLSKIGNAFTICVTNHSNSPIVKNSDLCIFTKADETSHSLLAMSSRIAQLAIFDAIYSYIVINSDKASLNAIYNTEYSLQSKKIDLKDQN